jgi:hypothetical protein
LWSGDRDSDQLRAKKAAGRDCCMCQEVVVHSDQCLYGSERERETEKGRPDDIDMEAGPQESSRAGGHGVA